MNKICAAIIAIVILTVSTTAANSNNEIQWTIHEYSYSRH
jgi:hypothetical protein